MNRDYGICLSIAAERQLAYDREDYRRSLYTNTKPDHPANPRTEGPCNCERGDTAWERSGIAMRAEWPRVRPSRGRSR